MAIIFETMAYRQHVVEGESYVSGSMVAVSVYQIQPMYANVLDYDDTELGINAFSKLLLEDYDQWYVPADNT